MSDKTDPVGAIMDLIDTFGPAGCRNPEHRTLRIELEQARADAERYRAALEQYADGTSWVMAGDPRTFRDQWRAGAGPDIARTALSKEADGE